VIGIEHAVQLASDGSSHVVEADGSVRRWGERYDYEEGKLIRDDTAVRVPGIRHARRVAVHTHVCAVVDDGTPVCWGNNVFGQLGDGTAQPLGGSNLPVAVRGLTDVVDFALALGVSCAARKSGDALCWGSDELEMLGNGALGDSLSPHPVLGLGRAMEHGGVVDLDVGSNHACTVTADGSVWCWGEWGYGSIAERVGGIEGAVQVTVGSEYRCALTADGTVLCWGANYFGELGPNPIYVPEPIPVAFH
jgi:alpha-tubulin suppressor-like RCC1 family protein